MLTVMHRLRWRQQSPHYKIHRLVGAIWEGNLRGLLKWIGKRTRMIMNDDAEDFENGRLTSVLCSS